MQAQIIDNSSRYMNVELDTLIRRATDVRIAVAFISRSGLALLGPAIEARLYSQTSFEFLIGLDMLWSEPAALRELYSLSQQTKNLHLYCYVSPNNAELYHPKLYLLRDKSEASIIVGSSNLTVGGLRKNVEVNTIITGTLEDEVISDAYGIYGQLKFLQGRFVPDEELIALYEEFARREKDQRRRARNDETIQPLVKQFKDKIRSLRPPEPTLADLAGWLGLVYEALPSGETTNKDIYELEDSFRAKYPGNKNIQAKIRQQLQILEKMKLVEHPGRGRWRKL